MTFKDLDLSAEGALELSVPEQCQVFGTVLLPPTPSLPVRALSSSVLAGPVKSLHDGPSTLNL